MNWVNGHDTRAVGSPQSSPGEHTRMSPRSPHGLTGAERSPIGSQSRMSIRKKSLREIPKDDVRLSQVCGLCYDNSMLTFEVGTIYTIS